MGGAAGEWRRTVGGTSDASTAVCGWRTTGNGELPAGDGISMTLVWAISGQGVDGGVAEPLCQTPCSVARTHRQAVPTTEPIAMIRFTFLLDVKARWILPDTGKETRLADQTIRHQLLPLA